MDAPDSHAARRQPPYDAIVFDCDSTLCSIEGIEELSIAAGLQAEVRAATDLAMNGQDRLESIFGKRLELVRPSAQDMLRLARRYVESLVPGARELCAAIGSGPRFLSVSSSMDCANTAWDLSTRTSGANRKPTAFS